MAISMSRYVRIISSVTGAAAVAQQRLFGRRFVDNPRVPIGTIVEISPGGAEEYFGADSDEARFANQYFSYISPAPASQAPILQFAAYSPSARAAYIFGRPTNTTLNDLKGFDDADMTLTIDEVEETVEGINLNAEDSFSSVAAKLTSEINTKFDEASLEVTVTYDAMTGAFEIKKDVPGEGSIKFEDDDLAEALGFVGSMAIHSPGTSGQSPLEAFTEAEDVTDSFGSASFAEEISLEDAIPVAEYVSAANVKYQMYWPVTSATAESWSAAMIDTASQGLILNETEDEWKEALPMAIMAATDYLRTNAAINYMFRQPGVTWTPDVTKDQDADVFDKRRVNYYGQTANAGQRISFFQRASLCGGVTAPLDMGVHANEQDLKAFMKAQLMSLLLTTNKIPANRDGKAMVLAIVRAGVDRGLKNGTILAGKTITELQKVAITQGSGDPLAWHDVQTDGYWYDAEIVQETDDSGVQEYIAKYTLFYGKGDSVRLIDGSHNLV